MAMFNRRQRDRGSHGPNPGGDHGDSGPSTPPALGMARPYAEGIARPSAEMPASRLAAEAAWLGSRDYATVGHLLRSTREELGWELPVIGAALRIKADYLAALERNTVEGLPGPTYATGFLRAYAEYLGLDGPALVRRFKTEKDGLEAKPDLIFPIPLTERGIPGGSLFLVALIVVALGYGTWYYINSGDHTSLPNVAPVPARLLTPPEEPKPADGLAAATAPVPDAGMAATAPSSPDTAAMAPNPTTPPAPITDPAPIKPDAGVTAAVATVPPAPAAVAPTPPAPPLASAAPTPVPPNATPPSPVLANMALPPAAAPTPPQAVSGDGRISVQAKGPCWIQITENGKIIHTGLLKAGESWQAPDRPGIILRAGNAGALDIYLDGKLATNGGPAGQVRNIALDPARLTAGSAVNPDPPKVHP